VRHTVATSRRFRRRRRLMMPMTVGGFPQTTRSSSSSIAHHHRPRVLRSDDDSLPKFAVVIPTVAIRDGDETHLVLLLVLYMWSSMCLEVVFKCILVSTSISRRITTVHFRACVYLSISLSLFLCVYVCSSFVTVVNDIRLLLCHAFMSFGHPFSNAYRKLSRWLFSRAKAHVCESQGAPFSCKYLRTSR